MQATTSPKVVDQRPAAQAALAAIFLAAVLAVGGAIGIALQSSAPAAPAAVGDHEASGLRNAPAVAAPVIRGPLTGGALVYTGANPGTTGKIADDQMSQFNGYGLSKPGADESEKVGRAHR